MPAAIFAAPLEVVDEIDGNGIDGSAEEEIILSVSTIVNGVKKSEAATILADLEQLGEDIKNAAFEAFMMEVTQKAMTVEEVKEAVEAVKVRVKRNDDPLGFSAFVRTHFRQSRAQPCKTTLADEGFLLTALSQRDRY